MKGILTGLYALLSLSLFSQDYITYYEILDAKEANKIYQSLKTPQTSIPGWPLPEGRFTEKDYQSNHGIYNEFSEVEWIELDENSSLKKVKVRSIYIAGDNANLAGIIPPVKLDSLEELNLSFNNLTGLHKDIQLPNLKRLDLSFNKLSAFPALPFPKLEWLDLRENTISGNLPMLNFPNLIFLDLATNNFSGEIQLSAPKCTYLNLDENKFSGSLLKISCPELDYFGLEANNFTGELALPLFPKLHILDASQNKFNQLADNFVASIPAIKALDLGLNAFQFDDLEPLANVQFSEYFSYSGQEPVPLEVDVEVTQKILRAKVDGTNLSYHWLHVLPTSPLRKIHPDTIGFYIALYLYFLDLDELDQLGLQRIDSVRSNELRIPLNHPTHDYACAVTHPVLTDLTIAVINQKSSTIKCWENLFFTFCFESEEANWESGEDDDQIVAKKPLIINNFIHFEGNLTLDTANLTLKADGKFFIPEIPLPGGGSGAFKIAEGEYALALVGNDGLITGFINDKLKTYTPDIGGLEINLEELKLIGGREATGISISFNVEWDNITPSCGDNKEQTSSIKISGLEITSGGISVAGMEVGDLGLAPGFCLKELKAAYDNDEDKLEFALTVLTPFIEIGGGIEFKSGELDAVELKAELQNSIIPIATTGVGLIGGEGKIANITDPPLNIKLGGIFSAVANDHLFRLTASAEYIPPAEIKIALGDGKFFNPPIFDSDWWLAEGGIYGSLDFKTYRLKMGGDIKMSPYIDEEEEDEDAKKKFMATGAIDMAVRKDPIGMVFTGQFKGQITIPALGDSWPYDWLSKKVGLPYAVDGEALLVYKPTAKFISGNVNLGSRIGEVHYDINLNKRYNEEGFFSFIINEADLTTTPRSKNMRMVDIPGQTKLAVITVFGHDQLPVVELKTPDQVTINENNPHALVDLDKDITRKRVFYTLYRPAAGSWTVSALNNDSIHVYLIAADFTFRLDADEQAGGLNVTWNYQDFKNTDSVEFYLDDDQTGFNGSYLTTTTAHQSAYWLDISAAGDYCNYYLYALIYKQGVLKAQYVPQRFINRSNSFPSPQKLEVNYQPASGSVAAQWDQVIHPDLAGYVLGATTEEGQQVLKLFYPGENQWTEMISGLKQPQFYIQSYGIHGETGCPVFVQQTVSVKNDEQVSVEDLIKVFPNPNSGEFTLIWLTNLPCKKLQIQDMLGRVVKTIPLPHDLSAQSLVNISVPDLPPGLYILSGLSGQHRLAKKIWLLQR